ncbi:ATP-binding protein [Brevundimonas sp. 2R-24]|uniref:histidine kinase n=1 Tax=Peiella sedimenti TaxID=3061083 RepID=A0ABT8SKI3_9CAUL|nr:ATP-binding protein [Caulobacteraceae bacterium XZ-24]
MNRLRRTLAGIGLPILAVGSLALLLAVAAVVFLLNEQAVRRDLAREAGAQADLLASAVSGALAFDDQTAAQDYVDAVQVNPNVLAAAIYDQNNRLVASYARGGETIPPVATPRDHTTQFLDGRLYVVRPVTQGGQRLGTARLRLVGKPLAQQRTQGVGLFLVVALSALLMTVLAVGQAALKRANRQLAARAEELAGANAQLHEQMAERERAEEALRQSQKLEAVGRLTGGVAHDFNNLLMVVSSAADMLQRSDDPKRREALIAGMRQAVERGSGLTRQLLAFSRRKPLKSAVVDVGEQVERMRILLERSLREDIRVSIDVQRPLRPVELDVGELELALLNLAVNARDAMPDGGELTITVFSEPTNDERICIRVADTGVGMSPAVQSRVFEPFFTTKEVGRGTGLGLSQVYGFARSSGGDVTVQSEEGRGAVFTLCLPTTDKALAAEVSAAPPAAPRARGRALLVEDDDGVAAGIGHMLRDLGYTYVRACAADEALKMFDGSDLYDLVISDMVMPGPMNGLALAREIRNRRPDQPIVLSTGFSEAAAAAGEAGFPLLTKPYGIPELAEAIHAAGPRRGTVTEA